MSVKKRSVDITCSDGFKIGATVFEPHNINQLKESGKIVAVVIGSATGVLQEYYHPMAEFLANPGTTASGLNGSDAPVTACVALCFDFRGTGKSKPKSMSGFQAKIGHHWARQDLSGVVDYLKKEYEPHEICLLGNSVGVHVLALTNPQTSAAIDRVMAVSANNAYIGYWKKNLMSVYTFFAFYVIRWLVCKVYGYYPASKVFGSAMVDLPTGVMEDWAKWMLNKNYCTDEPESKPALEAFHGDMLSFAFSDDAFATQKSFDTMFRFFEPHMRRGQLRFMSPKDIGSSVGHVGLFKRRSVHSKTKLWEACKRFLVEGKIPDPDDSSLPSRFIHSKM